MLDLVVVGAGPAGTAAAITARKAGLTVGIVEGQFFPRHRPGESLHPGCEPLLRQLDVWEDIIAEPRVRYPGITVCQETEVRFSTYGSEVGEEWYGIQLPREDLDSVLLRTAVGVGCQLNQPQRAKSLIISGANRVEGIRLASGTTISAHWTIDASGGHHWLARGLALPVEPYSRPLHARYGYVKDDDAELPSSPIFRRETTGWTWTARVKPNLYHWTRLRPTGTPIETPDEFSGLPAQGPIRGADVTWRLLTSVAGPGYFVAGDAAMVLDPAAANGVVRSMLMGIMAGHTIAQICRGDLREATAISGYGRWVQDMFRNAFERMKQEFPEFALKQAVS
jgi:flavin-dependent dehydrogenase